MTEEEWLTCEDPDILLTAVPVSLHGQPLLAVKCYNRKQTLFLVACCRQRWDCLTIERDRRAVEPCERRADEIEAFPLRPRPEEELPPTVPVANCPGSQENPNTIFRPRIRSIEAKYLANLFRPNLARDLNPATQVAIIREILGNHFRPATIAPSWLTPTVQALAHSTYDNRNLPSGTLDNDRLAILADALEDAGCDNQDILAHFRGPGNHVRGCWGVDLILVKE